jgi:DNA helicase II / ATP-dependent DNA helicase PcrA
VRTPTAQQFSVLTNTNRVRVVRAAPGSGKTTLIGMLIRQELENWPANGGGIAALSFTRVGGQEIRKELGYDLGHPHFVRTIDSFLFRFVVRPMLKQVHPTWAEPRLIPADWSPKHWTKGPNGAPWVFRGKGGKQARDYNLFEVSFTGEDENGPQSTCAGPYLAGSTLVPEQDRVGLLVAKRQCWERFGWLTHADAALLASQVLSDVKHGTAIRRLLLRRFPLLIVDELQDTGFFLAKSVRQLLAEPTIRGVLVGDPNQAIYEFNGARPKLFNEFEAMAGMPPLSLGESQRCLSPVVAAATHVKESDDPFDAAEGDEGRAMLVRYAEMVTDVNRVIAAIRTSRPSAEIKVVVRWNATISEFKTGKAEEIQSLRCPSLTHMSRAVQFFRQGHNVRALANVRAAIELAVFGHEGLTDDDLEQQAIDARGWKALAVRCLLQSNAIYSNISMQYWQSVVGSNIDRAIQDFGLPANTKFCAGKLKPKHLTGKQRREAGADKPFSAFAPIGSEAKTDPDVPIQTVHGVKGETHDVTVFVWPPASRYRPCPSRTWWSADPSESEERRIAYVAMTRSRRDLIMCIDYVCFGRLCADRAGFVGSFQCQTIDECIATFE